MAVTVDQFGKSFTSSNLGSLDELKSYWAAFAENDRPKTGDEFAQRLVEQGKLTRFQADELLAGRGKQLLLGDYVLLAELGAGGMGKVYQARHRTMQRLVALKVISPTAMADAAAVKRFQREVRAAARLEHPNVVTAYDSGDAGNVKYLVMQFVDGRDLSSTVKQNGPLSVETAVEYVAQAAQGLAFAHGEGVIHRDVKPANLLVDKKGTVKILDLGLARIEDAGSGDGLTATEQVMGTVDYMAPEQASDSKHVDGRADVYSLGCTLWYLLTGKRMYDGDTMIKRLMKHRDAPLPSLVKARDDASWSLEQVFHKMVAKAPQDRYASMEEVLEALEPHRPVRGGGSKLGVGSSIGVGPTRHDAELSAFLKTVGPAGASKTTTAGGSGTADRPNDATAHYAKPEHDTDPQSEVLAPGRQPDHRDAPSKSSLSAAKRNGSRTKMLVVVSALCAVTAIGAAMFFLRGDEEAAVPSTAGVASAPQPIAPKIAPSPAKAPFDAAAARRHQQAWAAYLGVPMETTNALGMKLILVPPGEYRMGSTEAEIALAVQAEGAGNPDLEATIQGEGPQHRVVLTRPYHVGVDKVTLGAFRRFVTESKYVPDHDRVGIDKDKDKYIWNSPAYAATDDFPVECLSWNDAVEFCNWLSKLERLSATYETHPTLGWIAHDRVPSYRLPSEAEWEYAYRAGTTTRYFWGDELDLKLRSPYQTKYPRPGGEIWPNPFGLRGMCSRPLEWCQDWYDAAYYAKSPTTDPLGPAQREGKPLIVLRGERSAKRLYQTQRYFKHASGFRVVRTVPMTAAASAPAVLSQINAGGRPKPPASSTPSPSATPTASTAPTAVASASSPAFFTPPLPPPSGNYALEFGGKGIKGNTRPFVIPNWSYRGDTPLTIEFFVHPRRAALQYLLGDTRGGSGYGVRLRISPEGMFEFEVEGTRGERVVSDLAVDLNRTIHVAATYDRSNLRLFIDGVEQKEFRSLNVYAPSPLAFYVGAASSPEGKPGNPCSALLDEIRISRVVRYDENFTPAARHEPDADTEVLYHFDEGIGSVTRDASPHGRHAVLESANWLPAERPPTKTP